MNKREVFQKVKKHLLTQGKRSMLGPLSTKCAYRGHGDMMCAVGCLIKDEFYSEELENRLSGDEDVKRALQYSGIEYVDNMQSMLAELQLIHDEREPDEWEYWLDQLEEYGLDQLEEHWTS